jgi:hypothetical protein
MPPKSKITLSDSQKHEFCLHVRNSNKMTRKEYVNWIEQKWGVRVDESTITRILQKSDDILNTEIANPEAKRHKSVTVPELELALKEFVLIYQDKAILSEAILIEKAKQLADGLGIPDGTLVFSAGWLQKFKERNGIRQQKLHGEASSANLTAIDEALPLLKSKCECYSLDRIYNMDETGLFYRLEPDRTLATQRLSGRKKNKERLTIALCANADGSHKLDPLIIGQSAKPRCFTNVNLKNLSMTYRNNKKAWMLTTIFQDWLQEFNKVVAEKYKNQRVLLLLDNCSSHKTNGLVLSNVDVHFLPPNTTSKIQPMDAGVIMSFKKHYRNLHIKWILDKVQKGTDIKDLKMDVLQAMHYIIKSWEEIIPETIHNCWKHTKILPDTMNVELPNLPSNVPTSSDLTQMLTTLNLPNQIPIEEFLSNPEEEIIYEAPEDDKIIEELIEIYKKKPEVPADINEDEDDSTEPVIISANEASKSLEIVHAYLLQQENSKEQLRQVNALERYVNLKKINSMKQTTMNQFF